MRPARALPEVICLTELECVNATNSASGWQLHHDIQLGALLQFHRIAFDLRAVHFERYGLGFRPCDTDRASRIEEVELRRVTIPVRWNFRAEADPLSVPFNAQDRFHGGAVEPPRRARVPRPAAPAGMVARVYVGGNDV